MKSKVITRGAIQEMIVETAKYLKTKKEITEKALELENTLKSLEENYNGFASSFGFQSPGDVSNKTKTGFVGDNGPLTRLSKLGAEIQDELKKSEEGSIELDEMAKLKEEIAALKSENEKLKK